MDFSLGDNPPVDCARFWVILMHEIEVGDLVKRIPPHLGPPHKVYLVAEIEKREHSDGRPILGPHGAPSWCKLHDDEDRLTAVKSLTVVLKARR